MVLTPSAYVYGAISTIVENRTSLLKSAGVRFVAARTAARNVARSLNWLITVAADSLFPTRGQCDWLYRREGVLTCQSCRAIVRHGTPEGTTGHKCELHMLLFKQPTVYAPLGAHARRCARPANLLACNLPRERCSSLAARTPPHLVPHRHRRSHDASSRKATQPPPLLTAWRVSASCKEVPH